MLMGMASVVSCWPREHPAVFQGRRFPDAESDAQGAELTRPGSHTACCCICLALQAGRWQSLPLSYLPEKVASEADDLGGSEGSQALTLSPEVPEPQAGS